MTVVIALKKKFGRSTKVVMAGDSLFSEGIVKLNAKDTSKIIKFPKFMVGFSGICVVQLVLKQLVEDKDFLKEPYMKMENIFHALEFSRQVFRELNSRVDEAGDETIRDAIGELLIVTKQHIFRMDRFGFGAEFDQFSSIGCVNDLCAGVLMSKYDNVKNIDDLLELADDCVRIACEYSTGCDYPISIEVMDEPPAKKVRKVKK